MEPKKGYIHVEPVLGNYVHGDGKLGDQPIQSDGQWDTFLPETHEQDINGFEVYDCVTEATINCVETLEIQQYGSNSGWARRFLAKNSGTDEKQGNDPQSVSECLRIQGCTYETDYSFTASTLAIFYQALTQALKTLALGSFSKFSYGHSWVNADPASMMQALTYSPLSAAGFAWSEPDPQTGYYTTPTGTIPEHDFMIYGYDANNYWKVRDSYPPFEKKLAWDFQFTGIKRHTLNRQAANTPAQQTAWQKFLQILYGILRLQGPSFGSARSPQWEALSRAYRKEQPFCEFGMHKPSVLNPLNTHHIAVFHEHPELELVKSNWINVCRFHHLWHCHLGNWKSFNANVRAEAEAFTKEIKSRP